MARQHVFPVCSPTLKVTEVTGILGDEKPWKENANKFYFQDGEDDVEIVVRGPNVNDEGDLRGISILPKDFVGEYLIDYLNEVSIPEGPSTDFGSIAVPNYFSSYRFFEDRDFQDIDKSVFNNPSPGSIMCFGLKLGDVYDGFLLRVTSTADYVTPFGDNYTTDIAEVRQTNKNSWITLMWSGSRWVWLGSNNWY
jgi:hypothetical protein